MLLFADGQIAAAEETSPSVIDETLFFRIAQGEKEAFRTLYEAARVPVYAYALSLLRSREDAEDAAQDTFLRIRSAAHLYNPQGKPMAWILTITKNICLMKFRQRHRGDLIPLNETAESLDLSPIRNREDRIILEAALRSLSPEESRIIILHAVSGLKHREISEITGLPLATVLSKYRRGIAKLRRQLEGSL